MARVGRLIVLLTGPFLLIGCGVAENTPVDAGSAEFANATPEEAAIGGAATP